MSEKVVARGIDDIVNEQKDLAEVAGYEARGFRFDAN